MIEKTTRMNMLYDFYESLLTDKQREYMELYYKEDYSLGEIASEANVSRQAIYDTIRRTEQVIETYEEKLKLYDKFLKRATLLKNLRIAVKGNDNETAISILQDLENMN